MTNLECPHCDTCADFCDIDAQGVVCCPGCGIDFNSTKPKSEARHPNYVPWDSHYTDTEYVSFKKKS